MQTVKYHDLGRVDYKETWDFQTQLVEELLTAKRARQANHDNTLPTFPVTHHLIFCEHPHVYTLGRNGKAENLLLSPDELTQKNIDYFPINRGGDITYHGPGQLVGYPIFDLDFFYTDIGRFVRNIEEIGILLCAKYGLKAARFEGKSGVWLEVGTPNARKIMAIGIHLSRWVSMHGFALNVNTELDLFDNIVPCGIREFAPTSLQKELGFELDLEKIKTEMKDLYKDVFQLNYI
jgi:lipoyl(octanoyl) transferase